MKTIFINLICLFILSNCLGQTITSYNIVNTDFKEIPYKCKIKFNGIPGTGNNCVSCNNFSGGSFYKDGLRFHIPAFTFSSGVEVDCEIDGNGTNTSSQSTIFIASILNNNINISIDVPIINGLDCKNAKHYINGPDNYILVPYSSGNGADYPTGEKIPIVVGASTMYAKLAAGTLTANSVSGNLRYDLTGIPNLNRPKKINFNASFDGETCAVEVPFNECIGDNLHCSQDFSKHRKAVMFFDASNPFTGVLVNNYNQDGKYLVITAAHNLANNGYNLNNTYFNVPIYWDHETDCIGLTTSSSNVTNGFKVLAIEDNSQGDLALLELINKPPYNEVMLLGWNTANTSSGKSIVQSNHTSPNYSDWEPAKMIYNFATLTQANGHFNSILIPQISTFFNSGNKQYSGTPSEGRVMGIWGHWGAPLLNNNWEVVGCLMGTNGTDCNTRGPIFFETLKNSKTNNTSVWQILSGNSTSLSNLGGITFTPCKENQPEITNSITSNQTVKDKYKIVSSSFLANGITVLYRAGVEIELKPGFESGDNFEARIQECDFEAKIPLTKAAIANVSANNNAFKELNNDNKIQEFFVHPTYIGYDNIVNVEYHNTKYASINIGLYDINGKKIENLIENHSCNVLKESIEIKTNLNNGIYILRLFNGTNFFTTKIIKQ